MRGSLEQPSDTAFDALSMTPSPNFDIFLRYPHPCAAYVQLHASGRVGQLHSTKAAVDAREKPTTLWKLPYLVSKFGGALLKLVYVAAGKTDPVTKFSFLWSAGSNFRWLFQLRELYSNPFRIPWQNILLRRAIQIVQDEYPDYRPIVRVVGSQTIKQLSSEKRPVVIVTIHSEISSSIIRVFKDSGMNTSLIVASDPTHLLKISGCDFEIDLLPTSTYVLLGARDQIAKGNSIVCCSDIYHNGDLFVRKRIFDFAIKMELKTVFAAAKVLDEGGIEVNCAAPSLAAELSSTERAEMFVRFLHTALSDRRRWEVTD